MGFVKWLNNPFRRFDVRYVTYNSYPYALLYFTGSKSFNQMMRTVAMSFEYMLNEYGLYDKNGKLVKATYEKNIFELLNMEYLEPKLREV